MKHVVSAKTRTSQNVPTSTVEDAEFAANAAAWTAESAARQAAREAAEAKQAAINAILERDIDDPRNASLPEVINYKSKRP